ncbi:C12orf40 isoform 2 [Sigmodon hispidus]
MQQSSNSTASAGGETLICQSWPGSSPWLLIGYERAGSTRRGPSATPEGALTQWLSGEAQAAVWLLGSLYLRQGPSTRSSREMNWVGGSRTRVLIKQERRKQKEYFEKNKLKSKMNLLGDFSPAKNSTVSLDLLNLYMVNQISSKKKIPETMKRPTHVNMNRDLKIPLRKHDLELPMSPHCVPSKLCIDDMGNNALHQRLYSKDETGPVQSSQDMNSYRMFHKTENYSYTQPSSPAELTSNRHIPNQSSTSRITSNPQKFAYEKKQKEQPVIFPGFPLPVWFSNEKSSDFLFSKLNKHYQDIFSSSQERAEFGASYERINNSETADFLTRRSLIMGEGYGRKCVKRRQQDFAMKNPSVQQIWGNNGIEFSNFLDDVNQLSQRHLPHNQESDEFVSHNMINLLSRDQPGRMAAFPKCGYGSLSDTYVVSTDERPSTAGFIKGNFTIPQATFPNLPLNTSSIGTCQSQKTCQREFKSSDMHDFRRSCEKDCHPASCGRKVYAFIIEGKIESDDQEEALQRNNWEYPMYSMTGILLSLKIFSLFCISFFRCLLLEDEIRMEERGMCLVKGRTTPTEKIYLEYSQSSHSPSYSPRPTESTFSSSSDLISEDEDQIQKQIEDSNKKATETTDNIFLEKVDHVGDIMVKDNNKIHRQNANFHQSSVKNTDKFPESQYNLGYISQNKTSNNCVLQAGGCDAGVQTEKELMMGKTVDVAVQCTIISQCSCKSHPDVSVEEVLPLHKAGSCSEDVVADTTGGQGTLTDNSL